MHTTIHTDWAKTLAQDIDVAEKSIAITALSAHIPRRQSDTPHNRLMQAIAGASKRGLSVRVALPTESKAHPATWQNQTTLQWLAQHGCETYSIPAINLLHAKTCTIDNNIVWLGSGNYTAAACHHNHEVYARMLGTDYAAAMHEHWQMLLDTIGGARRGPW